jgi:4-hydroxy-tetrahydrodipicolinate synthase
MSGTISGVFVPVITPFLDGAVDLASYERILERALARGVRGILPLATTGEASALEEEEAETILERTLQVVGGRVPVYVGIGGNATAKVVRAVQRLERFDVQGILSVCPYYVRPSQDGLYEHFARIAAATSREVLIYNIPYRTGINLANDTLLRLAEIPNIVGAKDSSGDLAQSVDLLRRRKQGFAVMTGEDAMFYTLLAQGGDGGILAAAHLATEIFVEVHERMAANDHRGARELWSGIEPLMPLLFREANPMPLKYCLWRQGVIRSPECRLPLTRLSPALAGELDRLLGRLGIAPGSGGR